MTKCLKPQSSAPNQALQRTRLRAWFVKAMKRFFFRRAYSFAMRRGLVRSLQAFLPLWAASDAIYIGPVGPGATTHPEVRALRQIISCPTVTDDDLYSQLSHRSPWVAGYCFEALLARRSSLLSALPESLGARHESVSMGCGCFRSFEPLYSYVTHRLTAEKHDSQSNVA